MAMSNDTGRQFDGLDGSPRFLKIGVTLAHFHCDGNTVVLSDRLYRYAREVEITGAVSLSS